MRKLVATLKVYESDEDCTTALLSPRTGNTYILEMCPKSKNGEGLEVTNREQILAHELGHFVGHILKLPEHSRSVRAVREANMHGLGKDETALVPVEAEAWRVADEIVPNATQSPAYRLSMAGYRMHDKRLMEALETVPYVREALLGY
jgi:hypothetical protein